MPTRIFWCTVSIVARCHRQNCENFSILVLQWLENLAHDRTTLISSHSHARKHLVLSWSREITRWLARLAHDQNILSS